MLKFLLIVNKQGQTRFSHYYDQIDHDERSWIEGEIVRKCLARNEVKQCAFMEYRNFKVVYRRYASLFFIVGIDEHENELGIFEFIHNLVEVLDEYFKGVCELDIMYNLDKLHIIIDEMICNGYIVETSKPRILAPLIIIDSKQ